MKQSSAGKIKTGRGTHKPVKKQGLRWKSRMLLFQSTSWKSGKSEKAKAGFDVCKVGRGENKLDSMPRDLERVKEKS